MELWAVSSNAQVCRGVANTTCRILCGRELRGRKSALHKTITVLVISILFYTLTMTCVMKFNPCSGSGVTQLGSVYSDGSNYQVCTVRYWLIGPWLYKILTSVTAHAVQSAIHRGHRDVPPVLFSAPKQAQLWNRYSREPFPVLGIQRLSKQKLQLPGLGGGGLFWIWKCTNDTYQLILLSCWEKHGLGVFKSARLVSVLSVKRD